MSNVINNREYRKKLLKELITELYYAVRNAGVEYLGAMEVTQDIAPIQGIAGEKRLMSK